MNRIPKVSIVLPVRDAARTLPAALDSIRAQTFTAWELVVVDDGSTDETPRLLNAATQADARIRVLPLRPGGIVAALQADCDAAPGEFIARMDADDWMKCVYLAHWLSARLGGEWRGKGETEEVPRVLRHLQTIRLGVMKLGPHVHHVVMTDIPKNLNDQLLKLGLAPLFSTPPSR